MTNEVSRKKILLLLHVVSAKQCVDDGATYVGHQEEKVKGHDEGRRGLELNLKEEERGGDRVKKETFSDKLSTTTVLCLFFTTDAQSF